MKNEIVKKMSNVIMSVVMASSVLAGCGDNSENVSQTTGSEPAAASTETELASTQGEKVLKFGCFDYVDSIDPGKMTNSAWNCSRFGVGECLFKFNDSMEAEPALCDKYEVSDDHITWTFHIRDGVKFSNGEELTAQKVVDSFERLYACDGSSTPESMMDYASMAADDAAGTVTIVTNVAYPNLSKILAYPTFVILDVKNTTDYDAGAIGTGPYAITNMEPAVGASFVKNEYYWNGEVPFDRMELSFVNDSSAKTMALQSGQIDLAENITTVSDLETLKADPDYYLTVANGVRCGFSYINEAGVLGNDSLRQAVQMAVDTDTLCNITIGGLYTPGYSVLPSNLSYNYDKLTNPYTYNVDAANKLLDDAGILDTDGDGIRELDGNNIVLNYITYDNRGLSTLAEGVQLLLKDVGIGCEINSTDADTEWNLMVAGEYDLCSSNWTTVGTGDPQEYMANWYSKGTANYCNYKNEKYDELYDQLLEELDESKRIDLITQMQQILIDDAAVLVHGYYNSSMCASKNITGATIHTADYYWITTEIKPAE